jgi:tRNA threonylcarbamoyladenosine biosynthesis protein TsaE
MPAQAFDKALTSDSPEQTWNVAAEIFRLAAPNGVILLTGPLGSGKTTFVKGLARAAGIAVDDVSSPSFTLINEYMSGVVPVYHFDLYRLTSAEQFVEIGGIEYFDREGIKIVEWADHAPEYMPEDCLEISFAIVGQTQRRIEVRQRKS